MNHLTIVLLLSMTATAISKDIKKKEIQNLGFGEYDHHWQDCSLGRGEIAKLSKKINKPVMWILFWLSSGSGTCSACYHFQQSVVNQNEFQRLSKNFLMVNCEGKEIPDDSDFTLDGEYAPKILFTDVNNVVRSDVYNKAGKKQYKYYYVDAVQLVPAMKEAAVLLRGNQAEL